MKFLWLSAIFIALSLVHVGQSQGIYVDFVFDKMVLISTIARSWTEATETCELYNAMPMQIHSAEENEELLRVLSLYVRSRNVWTGGHRTNTDMWFWWPRPNYQQRPITFFNWAAGQPDNWGGNEKCVYIYTTAGGYWYDHVCEAEEAFVCQAL